MKANCLNQFLDGRFFFPAHSVRWQVIESNGVYKHHNPIGRACMHDIVLRSESVKRRGAVVLRNRGAVMSFIETRNEWRAMRGYTGFAKGVKIMQKPASFRETIRPGEARFRADLSWTENERDVSQKEYDMTGVVPNDWGAFPDVW